MERAERLKCWDCGEFTPLLEQCSKCCQDCCAKCTEKYHGRLCPNPRFIRHKMNIDEGTMQRLWDEKLIAIHYPGQGKNDSISLNPSNYSGSSRHVLEELKRLAMQGGYVCATYRSNSGCRL